MDSRRAALSAVFLATAGLSLKGIWASLAYGQGFEVLDVVFYRALLSLPLVLLGGLALRRKAPPRAPTGLTGPRDQKATRAPIPCSTRGRSGRKTPPRKRGGAFFRSSLWQTDRRSSDQPQRLDLLRAVGLGAFFSVGMVCDFQAIATVGAGLSRVILFAFPLLVMLLDGVVEHRWPHKSAFGGFLVAWLGLLLIAFSRVHEALASHDGSMLWALSSLMFYATFVWLSGRLGPRLGALRLTFLSNLTTSLCVCGAVLAVSSFPLEMPAPEPLAWVGAMVLVSTVVPYYLMNRAIVSLGATQASLLSMTGPVVTLVASYVVLDEQLTGLQLLGSAALLGGVAFAQTNKRPRPLGRADVPAAAPSAHQDAATRAPTRLSPRGAHCDTPGCSPG